MFLTPPAPTTTVMPTATVVRATRRNGQTAFTLVELLVVIAIIGVLVALLLPAVQMARSAARRATCQSRLHQIGIGLQSYHSSFGVFPIGGIEWRPAGNTTQRQISWCAQLLPYVEESQLYERLDLSLPFDAPANAEAAASILPLFLCPSSRREDERVEGRGPCDYGGIFGERITSPNSPPKGTMLYDRPIGSDDILDGLSRTLIVAEDTKFSDGQWINGRNIFDQAFSINAAPQWENDIRSDHHGGAQAVLADGAVRFLSESMDLSVLAAYCTRAGHEVVDEL